MFGPLSLTKFEFDETFKKLAISDKKVKVLLRELQSITSVGPTGPVVLAISLIGQAEFSGSMQGAFTKSVWKGLFY